jgi:hypothetical protein
VYREEVMDLQTSIVAVESEYKYNALQDKKKIQSELNFTVSYICLTYLI